MSSSSTLLSQINEDYLTCQICMEPFDAPKVLSCQHSFCLKCLESCEKTAQGSYILCPICRQRTVLGLKGVEGLKNNFVLSNIMEMLVGWRKTHSREGLTDSAEMCQTCPQSETTMATYKCIECLDHLCADCAAFHSRTKLTKNHEVVPLQDVENGKYKAKIHSQEMMRCAVHQNLKLVQYCSDCDALTCRDCIVEGHQGHDLRPIDDVILEIRSEVENIKCEMERGVEESRHSLEELLKTEEEERNEFAQIEQDIETLAQDFIAAIKEKRAELLKEIEEVQTNKFSNIVKAKEHLDMQLNCMLNCTQLSNYVLEEGTLSEILSLRKKMSETMKELKHAAQNSEKIYSDNFSRDYSIRFVPGNIVGNATRGMGMIEKRKPVKDKYLRLNVFRETKADKQLTPRSSSKTREELLIRKQKVLEAYSPRKEPCCSTRLEDSGISMTNEVLYVEIPEETSFSKPTPTPRRRKGSTDKLSPFSSPSKPPKPPAKPVRPLVVVKPQLTETPDYSNVIITKGTPLAPRRPPKPANKSLTSEHPRTSPIKPRPRSRIFSEGNLLTATSLTSKEIEFEDKVQSKNATTSIAYRVAPDPPVKPKKPQSNPPGYNTVPGPKTKSNKKAPAPPPPSPPQSKLKAEFLRAFGTKGQGYRDFLGPPQGVVMTADTMVVLDGDAHQVIAFNSEGFYSNRFNVNIPNQGKLKPTGLSLSLSGDVFVLHKNVVTVWTIEGTLLTLFGHGELLDARGIAIDSQDRVIVADEGKREVVIFSKRGHKLCSFGGRGEGENQLQCPRYVCTTSRDEIVVSEHNSHCVKIFDSNGQFMAKCCLKEAAIKYPQSVATMWPKRGQAEILLVADEGSKKVSAFDLRGNFLYDVLDLKDASPQFIATCGEKRIVIFPFNSIQGRIYSLRFLPT